MSIASVDTNILNSNELAAYALTADRRIIIGMRFALEMLQLPVPDCLIRKPSGRPTIKKLMAQADADSGTIRTYRDEKKQVGVFAPRIS